MYLTDVALEDVPESQGSAPDEEFGSLAILLGDPQECPACPTAAAETRLNLSLTHISEPTRLGMISYAVFCLKKKKN